MATGSKNTGDPTPQCLELGRSGTDMHAMLVEDRDRWPAVSVSEARNLDRVADDGELPRAAAGLDAVVVEGGGDHLAVVELRVVKRLRQRVDLAHLHLPAVLVSSHCVIRVPPLSV